MSIQVLNIANHGLMRFYLSKAVGVLMTAVPHWCWFSTWEPSGHQPTKCSICLTSQTFKYYSFLAGWALDYRDTIDSFISRNKDLHVFELSNADWKSIKLVTSWLKSFRIATTEMSATKVPMLSTTHTIFWGLQDNIKTILCDLPDSVSLNIKLGLTDAHRKLSDYYYQYDASPFYTWAACMCQIHLYDCSVSNWVIQVLDPRISYEGMKIDFADDPMLSKHLEQSKSNLFIYFHDNYTHAAISTPPSITSPSAQTSPIMGSPQKSFTARYRRKEKASINELEEYFKLPAEDFDACNPIQWWMGRRAQFLNLFHLARDISCIPGEFWHQYFLFLETSSLQVLPSRLSRSSQVVGTLFLSAVQASMPMPSKF